MVLDPKDDLPMEFRVEGWVFEGFLPMLEVEGFMVSSYWGPFFDCCGKKTSASFGNSTSP